ncbi:uncharacterized protein LOC124887729 [Capsicum annuum]|uniref:uncharacterized protein LOC124887729 n=1 Tax=Capsicum annuum TaxID=4072 RepID=UPI001FB1632C|nr:uncharacterized protein LOC124887729 [Capsicum annuum]
MVMEKDKNENQEQVLEDVVPLVIEAGNMMDIVNRKKKNLDTKNLVDNIEDVAVERDLSPKWIRLLKDGNNIEDYRRRLGIQHVVVNMSGKIWDFMESTMEYTIISDEEQQISLRLENQNTGVIVVVTLVYAKCTQLEKLQLWESLGVLTSVINEPLTVGGCFNVMRHEKEKLGGLLVTFEEIEDFNHYISTCNLEEIAFKGSKFTWWNGRENGECIFKRLDRWSKQTFGNIFQEIATLEKVIKVREKKFEEDPTGDIRATLFKAQAELAMQMKRKEELWKQKACFEWFKDGEKNTRFFHVVVKGRR